MESFKFTKSMKQLFLQQIISECLDKITERCVNWFEDVFIYGYDEESTTSLLKTDLDYLISKPEWLITLGKRMKFDMVDSERHVETYAKYIRESNISFRQLVIDSRYNRIDHCLYSPEEILESKQKWDTFVDNIMENFTDTKKK